MESYKWVLLRVTIRMTHIRGLITPLITTHEPPGSGVWGNLGASNCFGLPGAG